MKYDIYFHNDFDGHASAAVVLAFLEQRGDTIEHFLPVNYEIRKEWEKENFFETHKLFNGRKNPAIVVDFLYHPGAAMWFDHHPTTFIKEKWRNKFKSAKLRKWNQKYLSACHLVFDVLTKHRGFRPPRHFKYLVKWLDIIDMARYTSPKQTLEIKEPALQLDAYIENHPTGENAKESVWLINLLAQKPLKEIVRLKKVQKVIRQSKKKIERSLRYYEKHLQVFDTASYIDLTREKDIKTLRFAPFYLDADILHAIRLKKEDTFYRVGWGINPWRKAENKINVGKFLRERYGGGGHPVAGGAEFSSRRAAQKAVEEIVEYVNR